MQRNVEFVPDRNEAAFAAGTTQVVAIGGFSGVSVLLDDAAGVVTFKVGVSKDGPFPITVTLEGTEELRYPATDQMNIIYNSPYAEIEVTGSDFRVFLKG